MNRRTFLKASAHLSLTAFLLPACSTRVQQKWFVSGIKNRDGSYSAVAINRFGDVISKVPLPQRGHDVLALPHKPGHALIFARRPDRFVVEVNFNEGKIEHTFHSQEDTHMYGHGALSADKQYLYTTENHFDANRGVVVVRNTQNYQVEHRFDSNGIGPHQLKFMPSGDTLVVANGGISTHPDFPRLKLNLPTMQTNLSYLNAKTGEVIDEQRPVDHQLSLRHFDISAHGTVVVGAQYQGDKTKIQPLVFSHQLNKGNLTAFKGTVSDWQGMKHYTASIVCAGQKAFVTCPRGNKTFACDLIHQQIEGAVAVKDCAGLVFNGAQFAISDGFGNLHYINTRAENMQGSKKTQAVGQMSFDNHMGMIDAV